MKTSNNLTETVVELYTNVKLNYFFNVYFTLDKMLVLNRGCVGIGSVSANNIMLHLI